MEIDKQEKINATIVVVGDIGHSPRICNHALSLASKGIHVDIIGYLDSKPNEKICSHENIRFVPIQAWPNAYTSHVLIRLLTLPLKFFWILFALLFAFIKQPSIDARRSLILVQNPPGIPAMLICFLIAKIRGSKFVVDWHNYTSSMFRGAGLISKFAAIWEGFFGRLADLSICVSEMMRTDIENRWKVTSIVLYDRPPAWAFRPFHTFEKNQFLKSMDADIFQYIPNFSPFICCDNAKESQIALLVSSTSWTPDEDFSLLLGALQGYDEFVQKNSLDRVTFYPKILMIITGKGPLKDFFMRQVEHFQWRNVHIMTAWLTAENYPKLLASADIGICLHTSTSGLDLPMKVVDMFGCNLPVIAKRYPAIGELVQDGINGLLFDTTEELKLDIIQLVENVSKNKLLHELRSNLTESLSSWECQWNESLWPHLQRLFTEIDWTQKEK